MTDQHADQIDDTASSTTIETRPKQASEDGQDDPQIIAADAVPSPAPVFLTISDTYAEWRRNMRRYAGSIFASRNKDVI